MQAAHAPPPIECKICGHMAQPFGLADSSKSTTEGQAVPVTGINVLYHRCTHCHFLFTADFDEWSQADFLREIYNDDYVLVDPDFVSMRPLLYADDFAAKMASRKGAVRILDYGGGRGVFCTRMRELGFDCASHDPFFKTALEPRLGEKFEVIHCREVIEHSPDPGSFARDVVRFLQPEGVIYLSTMLQPPDILDVGLGWTYAAPRNGHISLFSGESLGRIWTDLGLKFGSFDQYRHIAWRGNPLSLACLATV